MTLIKRLLVANRGEIARRVMRTAHRMGLSTVAVYAGADARALHVQDASCAVALGGNVLAETYLNIDKIIQAAHLTGADSVHPGYGFLSENADFAQAVVEAGLVWVGPPASAIRALGNKSLAKALAQSKGVPCLPGYNAAPDEQSQSDARFALEAQRLGYPLMVKAAAGGGGRGMRLVMQAGELSSALHSARSEAQSAFGNPCLLLERALLQARHVEVQLFTDQQGHGVHLGERDCSVQRRHQKIIEESPSPAINAVLRERMGRCALDFALAAGYVGAGTVEFLLDETPCERDELPDFYLMEMNTRLQVEHPVTEARTGLDLVEWQLRVAQGEVLPLTQTQITFTGHALEVRLCSEDEQFTPHVGSVAYFRPPRAPIRFDHAIEQGMEVTPYFDAMLGKLIAHAPTRQQAIDQLLVALAQTQVMGLPTNRSMLMATLQHPDFQSGQARIPFLAEQGDTIRKALLKNELSALFHSALAVYLGHNLIGLKHLPCPFKKPIRLRHRGALLAFTMQELGGGDVLVSYGDLNHKAHCQTSSPGHHRITVEGLSETVIAVKQPDLDWHVLVGGTDIWLQEASFAPPAPTHSSSEFSEIRAPFNGQVIAIPSPVGTKVLRGDTLLVLESMKLEHRLTAPADGMVKTMAVSLGQQIASGQLLIRLDFEMKQAAST